ncbi:outer membrane lipoprotein LolB [Cupriavidus taiwanensis]|uniref:Outer-membrane lipoprotein LolB n=2 Tax=Cupriavidus taiwanensis TaxID=164546 RepID=LOLB_CUPTR|nr:outer membrane lipoprotein LolB [Cupriavidus taiwanensis]B2AGU0.1 RecName: Full=Outer-membrane lipoprotein LolB; Flags: Precursor [Cupriavidus taiwanensis LMG 19424]CAP62989.1 Outer-membrane lipoprotein lolB precursor [Cupriavidus taiwanensis LMG 19424]SOY54399.1 Outer-membrane lipoprotein LolB [Cupriavidus taiwanensis]SOY87387.1 Outer-membrane lipoprotein LolB [Cupriavidus taiwanensis]SOZ01196.1 Outer-membrane lipoprotein LolB [Cupriavidus taiwanensis]SOZ04122.1 Outer-membrane lipoprotein
MNRSRRLALLCLGVPLLLQACASVAPSRSFDVDQDAASRQYTGRFSANYVRYGRDEGVQGSFRWEEQGRNVRLDLVSPLGQTLAVVTATPSGATLDLPNQPPRNAPEVDTLMEEALGFALPVAGMRDWLHGRATQGSPARATRDEQGRLATLAQNGWTVRYVAWQDTPAPGAAATQVPRRIDLARDAGSNPLSVRLVIDPQTP